MSELWGCTFLIVSQTNPWLAGWLHIRNAVLRCPFLRTAFEVAEAEMRHWCQCVPLNHSLPPHLA